MSDPDCILVVVLKNSEPELSYIIGNNFTNMTQILEHTTAKKQNIQQQKISIRRSYDFTFFVLVVENVECLFLVGLKTYL